MNEMCSSLAMAFVNGLLNIITGSVVGYIALQGARAAKGMKEERSRSARERHDDPDQD